MTIYRNSARALIKTLCTILIDQLDICTKAATVGRLPYPATPALGGWGINEDYLCGIPHTAGLPRSLLVHLGRRGVDPYEPKKHLTLYIIDKILFYVGTVNT